jgi:hypothetical protein
VEWVNSANQHFKFVDPQSPFFQGICLTHNYVRASVRDGRLHYVYVAQRSKDRDWRTPEEWVALRIPRYVALYESPLSLRDSVLVDLDDLRRFAESRLRQSRNVTIYHMSTSRGGLPPMSTTCAALPEAIEQQLWRKVQEQLDVREQKIRAHYQEIYLAVRRALPLPDLPESPPAEESERRGTPASASVPAVLSGRLRRLH